MDVLDEPHRRRVAGERVETFEPRGEQLLLLDGRPGARLADGGEELGDDGGARRVAERRPERVAAAGLVEQLRDRFERREQVGSEPRRQDDGTCRVGARRELAEEARLADTRAARRS